MATTPRFPKWPPLTADDHLDTSPTAAWQRAMTLFKRRRVFENPESLARIKKLIKVLHADADRHYREADRRERGVVDEKPASIRQRLADLRAELDRQGLNGDGVVDESYESIERHVKGIHRFKATPEQLRDYAWAVAAPADDYRIHMDYALETAALIRTKPVGRAPSSAMHYLLGDAKKFGIGDTELARRLAAEGLVPDGPGADDSDLAAQWLDAIKSARYRARRRSKVTK